MQRGTGSSFPHSWGERRAAAVRMIDEHPHLSDRAIAAATGLGRTTVAALRRESSGAATVARIGQDGKLRPLSSAEGRRKAAAYLGEHPDASLREMARFAGISLGTASDVRKRMQRGEAPVPGAPVRRDERRPAPAEIVGKLSRDPSLRHSAAGRDLLRVMCGNRIAGDEWEELAGALPEHRIGSVAELAALYARRWREFARGLDAGA